MHHLNETKTLLVFSQSSPTLYLNCDISSLPHTELLFTSVLGIKANLYSFQKSYLQSVTLEWKPFNTKKSGKRKHHHSWRSINFAALQDVHTGYFQLFLFTEVQTGGTGFYLPIALPPVIPNGPGTEDVRHVNRRMKWALGCLSVD